MWYTLPVFPFSGNSREHEDFEEQLRQFRKRHVHRTLKSFRWAVRGFVHACATQRNLQIQLLFAVLVTVLMFVYPLGWDQRLRLFGVSALVLTCETFNTALEYLVDLYESKFSRQAMLAKDIAAGAVLISTVNAVIHGLVILGPFVWSTLSRFWVR